MEEKRCKNCKYSFMADSFLCGNPASEYFHDYIKWVLNCEHWEEKITNNEQIATELGEDMSKITESIFNGKAIVMALSDVQHIEKCYKAIYENGTLVRRDYDDFIGINVITDKTKWNQGSDCWENPVYISCVDNQAQEFMKAYCHYIYERDEINCY